MGPQMILQNSALKESTNKYNQNQTNATARVETFANENNLKGNESVNIEDNIQIATRRIDTGDSDQEFKIEEHAPPMIFANNHKYETYKKMNERNKSDI